jgi:hypothetical protein
VTMAARRQRGGAHRDQRVVDAPRVVRVVGRDVVVHPPIEILLLLGEVAPARRRREPGRPEARHRLARGRGRRLRFRVNLGRKPTFHGRWFTIIVQWIWKLRVNSLVRLRSEAPLKSEPLLVKRGDRPVTALVIPSHPAEFRR